MGVESQRGVATDSDDVSDEVDRRFIFRSMDHREAEVVAFSDCNIFKEFKRKDQSSWNRLALCVSLSLSPLFRTSGEGQHYKKNSYTTAES